jgi:hypothetical protein
MRFARGYEGPQSDSTASVRRRAPFGAIARLHQRNRHRLILRPTASAIAACHGQCSIERHTLITIRPRSDNTLCISEAAAALIGMNCKLCWQMTQSKVASANGMSVALPNRHSIAAAARARASMPALRSKPTTCPAEPILFATSRVADARRAAQRQRAAGRFYARGARHLRRSR